MGDGEIQKWLDLSLAAQEKEEKEEKQITTD